MVSARLDPMLSAPNVTLESCALKFEEFSFPTNAGVYCNWTWDTALCWPPTLAGTSATQKCPLMHGFDTTKFAERRCSDSGQWAPMAMGPPTLVATDLAAKINGSAAGVADHLLAAGSHGGGWTNYTPCYTPELYDLFRRINETGNIETIFDIAERTRVLEFVGLGMSLVALLISLGIFGRFRSLRNNRTRIHRNLFIAMCIQVVIRLTMYVDQAIIRRSVSNAPGIENTPILCEASYVLLEYAKTSMFMWMFVEGLYLHSVVTFTVFQGKFPHRMYAVLGWGGPMLLTAVWTTVMAHNRSGLKCWWGYNFTAYYWILEGPRVAVILLNFCFLLNIVRVLIVKLRQSRTSDLEQVRKAVRAAVVLLPLLGITNLLNMVQAPLDRKVWKFAVWSYGTHTLTSFQGFFIAMIYCFMNGEVRAVLAKNIAVYMALRGYGEWDPRRPSMFSGAYVTAPETDVVAHGGRTANGAAEANDNSGSGNPHRSRLPTALTGCLGRVRLLWRRKRGDKETMPIEVAANKMPLMQKHTAVNVELPNGHCGVAAEVLKPSESGLTTSTTMRPPESVVYI